MTELLARVSLLAAVATALLSVAGAWVAGSSAAVGVAAGGALAIANLWWLARRARLDADQGRARQGEAMKGSAVAGWALAASARFAALALAVAALLVSGAAHPIGIVVGLSILPPVLIAAGLQNARPAEPR